ncbi:hypothetical protein JCM3774_005962 [Rhodotorula dairenensis]
MLSKVELSAALLLLGASVASGLPLATPLDDPDSFDLLRRAEFDTIPTGVSLIDYFPRFTSPTSSSVFQAGGDIEISWNNTKPDYADNQIHKSALVILGYLDEADPSGGYHLDFQNPLGNVSFYSGSGSVSLPLPANLTTRSTYLLTMGSTRNISPLFTIEGSSTDATDSSSSSADGGASSSSTSSSAAASSSAPARIGSNPLTVYFPDGSVTVIGATATTAAAAGASSATGASNTSLNDIAAAAATSSAANVDATSSSPASSPASSTNAGVGTLAQASVAAAPSASTTKTSSASFGRDRSGAAALALGAVAAVVLAC